MYISANYLVHADAVGLDLSLFVFILLDLSVLLI